MDKKFWYFGIYSKEKRCVIWGDAHGSQKEALDANYNYILQHPGRQFIIQGFPNLLKTAAPK